jgi:hypothetical protein
MPEIKIKFCIGPQYFFVPIMTLKEKGGIFQQSQLNNLFLVEMHFFSVW